jgi:hypothetical protein
LLGRMLGVGRNFDGQERALSDEIVMFVVNAKEKHDEGEKSMLQMRLFGKSMYIFVYIKRI